MPHLFRRTVGATLALTLSLGSVPAWAGREVSCDSHSMRRNFCPTGEHGSVRLMESKGFWPCEEGRTWGTETDGIWVDRDCKGRFWVEDKSGGSRNRNTAIAAGAIAALVLGAAIAGNSKRGAEDRVQTTQSDDVPNWAIGRYHGYNPDARVEATLDLSASGRAVIGQRGRNLYGHYAGRDTLAMDDGSRLRIERTDRGLRTVDDRDRARTIDFYRDR
jgi:hypothetical protein